MFLSPNPSRSELTLLDCTVVCVVCQTYTKRRQETLRERRNPHFKQPLTREVQSTQIEALEVSLCYL